MTIQIDRATVLAVAPKSSREGPVLPSSVSRMYGVLSAATVWTSNRVPELA